MNILQHGFDVRLGPVFFLASILSGVIVRVLLHCSLIKSALIAFFVLVGLYLIFFLAFHLLAKHS